MNEVFFEAFMIMVTGMGTVFVFLLLLLGATHLLRHFTAPKPVSSSEQAIVSSSNSSLPSAHVAAITAAVRRFRSDHNH